MQSNETVRTKSAPKYFVLVLFLIVLIVAAASWWLARPTTPRLAAGSTSYRIEIAKTTEAREKGLSNRASLPKGTGMLFVFPEPAMQCFWMKDMQFPIDMLWINAEHEVIHIEDRVSPDTYPDSLCPDANASYVLELNAGEAARAGIKRGQKLNF